MNEHPELILPSTAGTIRSLHAPSSLGRGEGGGAGRGGPLRSPSTDAFQESPDRPPTDEKSLEQLTDEEFWDCARSQAQRGLVAVDVQPEHSREYLECHCRRGRFLIPLAAVHEVLPSPQQFTLLPAAPGWMPGLTAWHGEAMAVIDLDAYLSSAPTSQLTDSPYVEGQFIGMDLEVPASPRASLVDAATGYLLIGDHSNMPVGLLVPAIGPVTSIQAELLDASPADTPAVKGMYGEAFVLDVPVLLADVVRQIGMVGGLDE